MGGGAFCIGLQTTDTPRKDGSCGCLVSECFIIIYIVVVIVILTF